MRQVAEMHRPQVDPIGNVPGLGPICPGPLGPGPCEAIRMYLAQATIGGGAGNVNLQNIQVSAADGQLGPACNGPFGPMPCALVGQLGLDQIGSGAVRPQSSFGLQQISDPARLAAECARQTGLDLAAFSGCAGQKIILPQRQQAILDCAVNNKTTEGFARCAAPETGMRLSDDQMTLANCAVQARGEAASFAQCAGARFANRALGQHEKAVLDCATHSDVTAASFATCAAPQFLKGEQQAVLNCAVSSANASSFAACAVANPSIKMSDEQRIVAKCALGSNGEASNFLSCAGSTFAGRALGDNERAVIGCAANAQGDSSKFASCAANRLIGGNLSKEQQIALRCAVESRGDVSTFGGCAAANMFNLQLNPEQQIAVQCVVSTGGQPYAAVGCIASRLTLRELTKCLSDGIGGSGCFGDSNDLVGRNGFVGRTLGQIAGGPNSVFNRPDQILGGENSFVRNPSQIWGGDNSFVRNPGQIWGGQNSFVRNPSEVFGGPNSVFNNPGQLLPTPKPLQVGNVGGKRICLPWC